MFGVGVVCLGLTTVGCGFGVGDWFVALVKWAGWLWCLGCGQGWYCLCFSCDCLLVLLLCSLYVVVWVECLGFALLGWCYVLVWICWLVGLLCYFAGCLIWFASV